jgi:hypothetical protein
MSTHILPFRPEGARRSVCAHQQYHTYEKSDPACDSWVVLLRGVQAALIILSRSLSFSSIFSSIFLGWPERGNHLFARPSAFKGPLLKTAHSHTRPISVMWFSGLPTTRNTRTLELRTFHPFTHFDMQTTTVRRSGDRTSDTTH